MSKQTNTMGLMNDKWGIRLDFDDAPSGLFKVHLPNDIYPSDQSVYLVSKNKDTENRKFILSCNPMSAGWKQRLSESEWSIHSKRNPEYLCNTFPSALQLQLILLGFGGEDACLQLGKDGLIDIERLLKDGQLWLGKSAKMMRGVPGRCHSNSAELYERNKDNFDIRICTGYALSKDGMWREHSWLIQHKSRSNQIIETTKPRILYYGWVLSPEECEKACDEWIW